jgi:hypothetical protein
VPEALTTADFVSAAEGLRDQLALQEGATEGVKADSVGQAITRSVTSAIQQHRMDAHDNYRFVSVEDDD